MMKKLLVLMLVFVMASAASATLQTGWYYSWEWTDDNGGPSVLVGETITIDIFAGSALVASPILSAVLNVSDAASASSFALATPGDWISTDPLNGISADGSGGYDVLVGGLLNTGKVPIDAKIYSFKFVTDAVGTVTVDAVSGNWSTFTAVVGQAGEASYDGSGVIGGLPYMQIPVVVPEPMTIALLGLGSLFLLRRRK